MGFEDHLVGNIDRNLDGLSPLMKRAHERAQEVFKLNQVQETDFVDTYGQDAINRDLERVAKAEGQFEHDILEQVAEILEGIFLQEGEISDWFGPNAETSKASKFDDYFNGSDIVLEIVDDEDRASNFSLGVDVTFSAGATLGNKIDKIVTEIEAGKLGTIKYFRSERLGFEGRQTRVPHVVVGIELENVERLVEDWMKEQKRGLANHPVQYLILEEIKKQLEVFSLYADSIGQTEVVSSYQRALKVIEKIIEEKAQNDERPDLRQLHEDRVFGALRQQLERLRPLADGRSPERRYEF